jgi:hypothetical protein
MKPRIPAHDEVELLEKELFRSFERDEPPVRAHRVAAVALGLGGAALTSATAGAEGAAAGSIAPKAGALLLAKWVGIGTVAGAMSLGAVHVVRPHMSSPLPKAVVTTPAHAPLALRAAPAERALPTQLAAIPDSTSIPLEAPARTEIPVRATPTPTMAPARTAPAARAAIPADPAIVEPARPAEPRVTPSTLAAEVRLLDEARAALSSTDGPRALDALQRYARQFPAGTLNLEATVLRIEALFMTGSSSAATALARDFLAAHPTSTHAARVRRLLAEREKP